MTPLSGKVAGTPPRFLVLSKTVPSVSRPSYCTLTRSVGFGISPVPGVTVRKTSPDGVTTAPDSRAALSRKVLDCSFSTATRSWPRLRARASTLGPYLSRSTLCSFLRTMSVRPDLTISQLGGPSG